MKNSTLFLFFILMGLGVSAQVKDISLTLSPVGEYTFWDNQAGLNDGMLIGGKLGFGFGEYIELRGIYLQSLDLNTSFEDFGIIGFNPELLTKKEVTVTRWGGEFKANIGTRSPNPYITLGTGVQTIDMDGGESTDQIYANVGLGIKVNVGPRVIFTLEGKNTTYNFNAGEHFLTDSERALLGMSEADFSRERLSNWSIQGGLQFYLGGRRPGTLSELDQAYLDQFRGGLKGLQIVVEPGGLYIDFDKNSYFRDTYLLGTYAGVDFNKFIGLRGYYFHATQDKEISFDFDQVAIYGMEFRARLNDGSGVTPYITLGGGYINPQSDYLGRDNVAMKGTGFATGGMGLDIPLSKNLSVVGGVSAMLTSNESAEDISVSNDLQTHLVFNTGLKLSFGKNSKAPQEIYQRNINRELDAQKAINDQKIQKIKEDHQHTISKLEAELKAAYEAKDVDKAVELLEEKKDAEDALEKIEVLEEQNKIQETKTYIAPVRIEQQELTTPHTPSQIMTPSPTKLIQMTPVEFELLIERILKGLDEKQELTPVPATTAPSQLQTSPVYQQQEIELLNKRIDYLEKLLMEIHLKKVIESPETPMLQELTPDRDGTADISKQILERLDDLNRKIDDNTYRLNTQDDKGQTVIVTPQSGDQRATITRLDEQGKVMDVKKMPGASDLLNYQHASAFLGFNYGGASTANIGLRLHYDINKLPLTFVPEGYIGFGEATSFGLSGNVIYPFMKNQPKVKPYVGFGLGLASIDSNFHGNYNLILGAQLPVLYPNVYVDYTIRNGFKYNQIAIGYNFSF